MTGCNNLIDIVAAAYMKVIKTQETCGVKLRDLLEKGGYKGIVCREFYSLSKPRLVKPLCLYYKLHDFQTRSL